jgi:hypothetical protein
MYCDEKNVANGTACNDNNACTMDDVCYYGACKGTPKNCSDGNACTIDRCDKETGACIYTAKVCDDHNSCTKDTCDPATGCKFTPVQDGTACDDHNLCTTGDACYSGVCKGKSISCDDGDSCTIDYCNPITGSCVHARQWWCKP